MLLDVRDDHLKIVQDILQKFVPDHEVWAFGSRAKWLAKEYSDLDLCIVGEKPLSFRTLGLLEEAFEDSDLPYKVDVVDWATTSESFRKIIERDRVVVQKAAKALWRPSLWGDEISLEYGKALRGYENASGNVRVFGSNGPVGWTDKMLAKGPGVILGRKGAYRGVQYSAGDFFVIDTAYYVVPKTDLDMRWLYYAIQYHKLGAIDDGSPIPSTTRAAVYVRDLVVPPKDIQKEIARVLGTLDAKIALNRRINQTLEAMAQAIFKSWFVDFDPVKAKIAAKQEGRDPLRAAMSAISGKPDAELDALPPEQYAPLAATAALFPDEMEESVLGEIPWGWAIKRLPEVIDFLEGPGIRNWQYTEAEDGVRFINIRCIKDGDLKLDTASKITAEEAFGKYKHFQLAEDDIVISISGTLGRFGFVRKAHLPLSLNTSVVRFRPVPSRSTLHFIAGFVDTQLQRELETRASGSAQRNFGPMHLKQIEMLLPQYEILEVHTNTVDRLFRMRQASLDQIDTLTAVRDTLLPKLLSGELSVSKSMAEAGV